MIQGSIKKITKRLVIVSMVLCAGLWFAGCGNKEKEEEDNSNLPQVPSVGANDGKLENNGGENKNVTKENLSQFVEELEAAMWGDKSGAAKTRGDDFHWIDTTSDGRGGFFLVDVLLIGGNEDSSTASFKFFNYSVSGRLFLGGGAGGVCYYKGYYDEGTREQELKMNGEVKFNGVFKGSVVYKNYYRKANISDSREKTLVKESGDVVIKSGENEIPFKKYFNIVFFGDDID